MIIRVTLEQKYFHDVYWTDETIEHDTYTLKAKFTFNNMTSPFQV